MKKIIFTLTYFLLSNKFVFSTDVYAPKPFSDILTTPLEKSWTPEIINNLDNRSHVIFIESTGTNCLQVNDAILGNLTLGDVASLEEGNATYGEALKSMFQVLDMNIASLAEDNTSGVVTIHPELGSYYALDGEIGGNLIVRDKSSFYFTEQDTAAYLVFELDVFGEAVFIQASSRYIYNSENDSYESDPNWYQSQWLKINQDQTIVLGQDRYYVQL